MHRQRKSVLGAVLLLSISMTAWGQQSVVSLTLINADTNNPIPGFDPLPNGANLNLNTLPTRNLNMRANTNPPTVGSVRFGLDGNPSFQTETVAPYALAGDVEGNYNPWTPSLGLHTVTATPYTGAGGSGTAGNSLTLTFTVTENTGPTFTPGPTPTPRPGPEVSGELRKWHKLTITFDGPFTSENATPNPFLDYRLNVTFSKGSLSYTVPGYFAADGNAAETGAIEGNQWRAHFIPPEEGTWTYLASFRTGSNVAVSLDPHAGTPGFMDGTGGEFTVGPTNKTGPDFRGKGLLQYVGKHHLRFAETGEYYLKGGADSPENFLGYADFDGTYNTGGGLIPGFIHRYEPHRGDWREGDPSWRGGKGKTIIGLLNYLSSKGVNSVYFLTYNVDGGDGSDTWPWNHPNERYRFDCSKLDQWEIVFTHMDRMGIQLHVVTQETENDRILDGGNLGTIRKLYYRELIARFSHHLAVIWNLGEENWNTNAQRSEFAAWIRALDPYDHPITVHTHLDWAHSFYDGLLGNPNFEATSIQGHGNRYYEWAESLRRRSASAGRKWAIYGDEQVPAVSPNMDNLDELRRDSLWGNLTGGGAGVEWYFGYQDNFGDIQSEDLRVAEPLWDLTRYAIEFFHTYLPFWDMAPDPVLVTKGTTYVLAKPGEVYLVFLPSGGLESLQLTSGTYTVDWFNPRTNVLLQGGVRTLQGPGWASLGLPPSEVDKDWAVLIRRQGATSPTATLTPTHTRTHTPTHTPTPTSAPDTDGDGIADHLEGPNTPGSGRTNYLLCDSDGDGLSDGFEDANRNGIWDQGTETRATRCQPAAGCPRDTDGDGFEDGFEVLYRGSNPLDANSPGILCVDPDADGLPECMDPDNYEPDYDGDRILDGFEATSSSLAAAMNPMERPPIGDANCDNLVDNADAQLILTFFSGGSLPEGIRNGDYNRDGVVDNADSQQGLNFFGRISPYLPVQ